MSLGSPGTSAAPDASALGYEAVIERLLDRMDLEAKSRLLTAADAWSLGAEPAIGLRAVVTSDGPAGVRGVHWDERSTSANLPSATAIAATWDASLAETLGVALGREARRKGVDVVLAPTVNLHRSPYAGRHFECLSEDPLLTGVIGAALVTGVQSVGVAATVKHFVANDSESDRFTVDVEVDERTLRELYLLPFEHVVAIAAPWSVMAAYNSVNGSTMTENPLLADVLKGEWGFDGVVMTDWFAGRSALPAAQAGLDLMMPGPESPWRDALAGLVEEQLLDVSHLDAKVRRVLRLACRVGAVEGVARAAVNPAPAPEGLAHTLRRAAAASFVLLRNETAGDTSEGPLLPVAREAITSVAMVGPNAHPGRTMGGGSAVVFPPYVSSPLDGLRSALGDSVDVRWAVGVRSHTRIPVADVADLRVPGTDDRGVQVSFLGDSDERLLSERREAASFHWHFPVIEVDGVWSRIQVETVVEAAETGEYRIGASGVGRVQLSLDQEEVIDERLLLTDGADFVEGLMTPPQCSVSVTLHRGERRAVTLVYTPDGVASGVPRLIAVQLNVEAPYTSDDDAMAEAERLAADSDVAVVVVGTTEEVESEGFDRRSLSLPGRQDELVRRVAAVNPRTVVVVNAGSPVAMPWRAEVPAVLVAWFPGQEFGNALADVLLGVTEPGGRLPTTWPGEDDSALLSTRPLDSRLAYAEGRDIGYRRFIATQVEPAYWFGHGLGYTTWAHEDLAVELDRARCGARVRVTVRNTGARAGREVVQVYLTRVEDSDGMQQARLAGHTAVTLGPGESRRVDIDVAGRRFAIWDVAAHEWRVEAGDYHVRVGSSVRDIRATQKIWIDAADVDPLALT